MATFKVYATIENIKANPTFLDDAIVEQTDDEVQASETAQEFVANHPGKYVYVYFQNNDGSTGFLNPNGVSVDAVNWGK